MNNAWNPNLLLVSHFNTIFLVILVAFSISFETPFAKFYSPPNNIFLDIFFLQLLY